MKDIKYSLEIMQAQVKSPYVSPENKYAFETSIQMLKMANKLKELVEVYDDLLVELNEKQDELWKGKAIILKQVIGDLKELFE